MRAPHRVSAGMEKCQSMTDLNVTSSSRQSDNDVHFRRERSFSHSNRRRHSQNDVPAQKLLWKAFIRHAQQSRAVTTSQSTENLSLSAVKVASSADNSVSQQRDITSSKQIGDASDKSIEAEWTKLCETASHLKVAAQVTETKTSDDDLAVGLSRDRAHHARRSYRLEKSTGDRRHDVRLASTRGKRALPQVPVASSMDKDELLERRKRISEATLKRLQLLRSEVKQHSSDSNCSNVSNDAAPRADGMNGSEHETVDPARLLVSGECTTSTEEPVKSAFTAVTKNPTRPIQCTSALTNVTDSNKNTSSTVNTSSRSAFTKLRSHKTLSTSVPNNLNLIHSSGKQFETKEDFLQQIDQMFKTDDDDVGSWVQPPLATTTFRSISQQLEANTQQAVCKEIAASHVTNGLDTPVVVRPHSVNAVSYCLPPPRTAYFTGTAPDVNVSSDETRTPTLQNLVRTCDLLSIKVSVASSSSCEHERLSDLFTVFSAPYSEGRSVDGSVHCIRAPVGQRSEIAPSSAFHRVAATTHQPVLGSADVSVVRHLPAIRLTTRQAAQVECDVRDGDFLVEVRMFVCKTDISTSLMCVLLLLPTYMYVT